MPKSMEEIVSLCKRRGFIFQSSEIYGGINGFWDYGPLGVELKRNVREAWWRDMITNHDDLNTPPGAPSAFRMVGVETSIIMHPQVWKVSGHYDLFSDRMVDCRETKERYRFDHLRGRWAEYDGKRFFVATTLSGDEGLQHVEERALKFFGLKRRDIGKIKFGTGPHGGLVVGKSKHQHGLPKMIYTPNPPNCVEGLRQIWDAGY